MILSSPVLWWYKSKYQTDVSENIDTINLIAGLFARVLENNCVKPLWISMQVNVYIVPLWWKIESERQSTRSFMLTRKIGLPEILHAFWHGCGKAFVPGCRTKQTKYCSYVRESWEMKISRNKLKTLTWKFSMRLLLFWKAIVNVVICKDRKT